MIRSESLTFSYGDTLQPALDGVDLEIGDGRYVALLGPNGCGKTTLVKHFNALLVPGRGQVWVDGLNTRDAASRREIRRRVGLVFQNPDNQIVGMTVEEDVAFGPGNLGLPPPEIRRRVERALETVGLEHHRKRSPHSLSGGEKRLVAIAGVLAMEPKVVALDEPTAYLDPGGRDRVLRVVRELNRRGMTVVHIAHDMDEVVSADVVLVMDRGRIVLTGSPSEVFCQVERLSAMGLSVPVATVLMWQLSRAVGPVRRDILRMEEAVEEIRRLIGAGRRGE